MYGILLDGLWSVLRLVAGDPRPRCGHQKDPAPARAGLGVQGARAFGLAFWVYAQGVCVRRVCASHASPLFASSGSEDQGRGFGSELLGLKVGGQIYDFESRIDEGIGQEFRIWTSGFSVYELGDHGLGLNSQGSRIEA